MRSFIKQNFIKKQSQKGFASVCKVDNPYTQEVR